MPPRSQLSPEERMARDTLKEVSEAWRYIHQTDPPPHTERALRALLYYGATPQEIVDAVVKAALKPIEDANLFAYALGIIRTNLENRGVFV